MRPAVEAYLDRILAAAALGRRDEDDVREELASHLEALAPRLARLADEEVTKMLENDFGDPDELGREIADARGRFRSWLRRRGRVHLGWATAAVVVALGVRWQVAEAFQMSTASMDPAVPAGSWLLVNKWADVGDGDLVVCDDDGRSVVARVERRDGDELTVAKLAPERDWPRRFGADDVVGRVWLVTR